MQTIQTVFDTLIEQVKTSPGSLFTKDDVCNLLSDFEKQISTIPFTADIKLDSTQLDLLNELLIGEYEHELSGTIADDVVNFDTAEFSVYSGNALQLDSIDLDRDTLSDAFERVVDRVFSNYEKNFK